MSLPTSTSVLGWRFEMRRQLEPVDSAAGLWKLPRARRDGGGRVGTPPQLVNKLWTN